MATLPHLVAAAVRSGNGADISQKWQASSALPKVLPQYRRQWKEDEERLLNGGGLENEDDGRRRGWIAGSLEVSYHEFGGTLLGMNRTPGKVLYITEVAVLPEARRCGVARQLLSGLDKLAQRHEIESLYLHVDVTNTAAINLYLQCGYRLVERNPIHNEFTRSLNLHDGAIRGRVHHLMRKDLRPFKEKTIPESVLRRRLGGGIGVGEAFLRERW